MSKKRRRSVHLNVMVTPEERELIQQRMNEAGIRNMGAYMRKMALNGYVLNVECNCKPLIEGGYYEIHIANTLITASAAAVCDNIYHHISALHHGAGCGVISVIVIIIAVAAFVAGETTGAIAFLVIAVLVSPYTLPAAADRIVDKMRGLCFALKNI